MDGWESINNKSEPETAPPAPAETSSEKGGATVENADNQERLDRLAPQSGATPSGPAETSVEAGEEVMMIKTITTVGGVPGNLLALASAEVRKLAEQISKDHSCENDDCWLDVTNLECLAQLLSSALQAERRKTLEEAAIEANECAVILNGKPTVEGYNAGCKDCAAAIRALASAGAGSQRTKVQQENGR